MCGFRVYHGTKLYRVSPGEFCRKERVKERDAAEEKQQKLFQTSPLALWEIISYRRDLENLTQSTLTLPLRLHPQFPTANWPICLRLQPKINSLTLPHPPCDHTQPSVALTHTHTLVLPLKSLCCNPRKHAEIPHIRTHNANCCQPKKPFLDLSPHTVITGTAQNKLDHWLYIFAC